MGLCKNADAIVDAFLEIGPRLPYASTVLAQDHFYSDFLSLSLTTLTHKGSMGMNHIRCDVESATAFAAGGMNIRTADFLNGLTFVIINGGLLGLATRMRSLFETARAQWLVSGPFM